MYLCIICVVSGAFEVLPSTCRHSITAVTIYAAQSGFFYRCQGSHNHGKLAKVMEKFAIIESGGEICGHGKGWKSKKYQKLWKNRNFTLIRVQNIVFWHV